MKTQNKLKMSLLLLFAAIQLISVAQKCKYKFSKEDPISGEKEQRINICYEPSRINNYSMAFNRKGDNFLIESTVEMQGEQNFIIKKGSKTDIKLTNGEIMSLILVVDVEPVSSIPGPTAAIRTSYTLNYKITKEELKEIEINGIQFVRTYLQNETQFNDYTMKDNNTEKTKEAARCIVQ